MSFTKTAGTTVVNCNCNVHNDQQQQQPTTTTNNDNDQRRQPTITSKYTYIISKSTPPKSVSTLIMYQQELVNIKIKKQCIFYLLCSF